MSEPRLIGEKHLKMRVTGPAEPKLETIWWNRAETEQTVAVTNGIRHCRLPIADSRTENGSFVIGLWPLEWYGG